MRLGSLTAVLTSTLLALVVPTACGGSDDAAASKGDEAGTTVTEGGTTDPDGAATTIPDASVPDSAPQAPCTGKPGLSGDRAVKLMVGATERTFDLHVPATYDATKRTAMVFVFHGYTMTSTQIATASHFAAAADKHGMITLFPQGTQNSFNAGDCCGTAQSDGVDEIAFANAMIASLDAEYCVDAKRVFSAGFSNGGFLSYRFACELADKIAAVAPVAGGLRIDAAACKPKRPVPLLHIHGTNDLLVPYTGGGFGAANPVSYSIDAFKTKNGCAAGAGTVVYTKDDVSCTKWSGCTDNADVELCTVTGGGHAWPGGDVLPYGGSTSQNLDASETIAAFFDAHPMK